MANSHTKMQLHDCPICRKSFSRNRTLKTHMLTHNEERPHQGEQCGKTFSQRQLLKTHMLTHTGERPHECEQCGKTFAHQSNLKRHMLTHNGENVERHYTSAKSETSHAHSYWRETMHISVNNVKRLFHDSKI